MRILEGTFAFDTKVHFEIGIAMYGPFNFPKNCRPISPVVWLCILEENIELIKPFELVLPHFLNQVSKDKLHHHQLGFAKASHRITSDSKGIVNYNFQECESEPILTSFNGLSFAVLKSQHFCFYCIKVKESADLAKEAGYCLTRIECHLEPQRSEIFFCVTYLLKTCLKVNTYQI